MAGLVPAIHVLFDGAEERRGRRRNSALPELRMFMKRA
jgi:hypothetical protein